VLSKSVKKPVERPGIPKSEPRNPKEIRNPKSERRTRALPTQLAITPQSNCLKTFKPIAGSIPTFFRRELRRELRRDFGLRSSAFFRISDFAPSEFPSPVLTRLWISSNYVVAFSLKNCQHPSIPGK
jgi:hypothetical protein